jgi:hypothetical protein
MERARRTLIEKMRIRALLVLAAACSGTQVVPPPPAPTPVAPAADAAVATVDAVVDAAPPPARFARVEAPPAGPIRIVAAAADAAVTADELGGVRLWPALDGSAEPVIVDLPPPSALAIAPRGPWWAIAMIDDAGDAIVANVDGDGQIVKHAEVRADGARFAGVVAVPDGFLLSSDRALVLVDHDGKLVNTLTGKRVVAVAAAGKRAAAAVVDDDGKRRTWWIGFNPLSWDATISNGNGLAGIALSATRLAGIAGGRAVVIDLNTGQQLASAPAPAGTVLGLAGERLAIAGPGSLAWLGGGAGFSGGKAPAMLAIAGDRVLSARGGDLAIATPAGVRYLGYAITDARVEPAGGKLLVGMGDRWAFVDANLDVVGAAKLAPGVDVETMRHLAGDDWLVISTKHDIYIANAATGAIAQVHTRKTVTLVETAGDLVAFGDGTLDDSELFRYAGGTLAPVPLPKETGLGMLHPVDPKLAHGFTLVRIGYDTTTDVGHLRWIRDLDHPDVGAIDLDVTRYATPAVDAAGRVYVTRSQGGTLAIYDTGKLVAENLDFDQALEPAPSGNRYVAVGFNELSMHAPDGKPRWTHAMPNRERAIWLDDDHLVSNVWPGISTIDVATGALGRTRCGWQFGLSAKPNPPPTAIATACTRLADTRGDRVEPPGDAGFRKAMHEIADRNVASIAEWGIAPINGTDQRFAVIVANPESQDRAIVGYIVEIAPGSYIEAVFGGWGFVQPTYAGLAPDPAWTVGAAATSAREDKWSNPISKYRDGGFSFEKRWIHMSGEEFHFTVRANAFVVMDWNWIERERDNTGMHSTGERKTYAKAGTCGTGCPKLEGHKTHSTKLKVVGPTSDVDALAVGGDGSWAP